jgi:hypothetical protein
MRYSLVLIALLSMISSFAQKGDKGVVQYRKEKISQFEFEPFERSFTGVDESMDSLMEKKGENWGFQDSLQFIINIAKIGNYSRAYNELKTFHLHDVSNESAAHLTMIYQLNERYDLAERWLQKYEPENKEEQLAKKIWLNMIRVRQGIADYKTTLKYEELFTVNDKRSYTDKEKEGKQFQEDVLYPLDAGEIVLRFHIQYMNEKDALVAKLASQMGDVIHQHFSLTMTYVAYSLAKHYDNTSANAKKLKNVKSEILEAKYEIIPLRNFFPKQKRSRFSYELIKAKKEDEKVKRYELPAFEKEQEESIWFSKGFIILTGLLLILLFVIFFIKTNKK